MSPTTEVLLCTYNGAAFVIEQLRSILAQTTRVDRVSIYDDQSSDNTVDQIRDFLKGLPLEDQHLFHLHVNRQNLGYAANFSHAIANSTEDLLFLCDQDDVWQPDKVKVLVALFSDDAPDMVFSDGWPIDNAGQILGRKTILTSYGLTRHQISRFREDGFYRLVKRNYINGAAAAIRRVTAQTALPLPCDMPHDYWLGIWSSLHNGVLASPETLYGYRQHRSNAIGMGPDKLLYLWLGVWRQPDSPRERELRIWQAITNRVVDLPRQNEVDQARRKLRWLTQIVTGHKQTPARALRILKSCLDGSYRTYSPSDAALRDIVSLIKG